MNLNAFLMYVRLCRTQRKTPPTGGRRSKREWESWVGRRRSQISQWLHGVMCLWSAAMDCNPRSLLFVLLLLLSCVIPAFPVFYPPNEGKGTQAADMCVCVYVRTCVYVWMVRYGTYRGQSCALVEGLLSKLYSQKSKDYPERITVTPDITDKTGSDRQQIVIIRE